MADLKPVRVAVRVRPISESELAQGHSSVVKVVSSKNGNEVTISDGKITSARFAYSHTFAPHATQLQLYESAVVDLLGKLFEGFNVTILAYGQTCSGKTFTMGMDFTGELTDSTGVIPRVVTDVFRIIAERDANKSVTTKVTCSFIELYQEAVFDLLAKNRQSLDIREGGQGVMIQGLTEIPVESVPATLDCLLNGSSNRCVGATAMNSSSSRSHAIFTINISMASSDDPQSVVKSKFHLVDLAGSERSKKTQATGDRFKEGVKINQGLLALGNVISTLSMLSAANSGVGGGGSAGTIHVPYRDSKLTRLLQDSLGGNSYMLMIACVSPADYNKDETLSTLRYADRACKIKNKPVVNIDPNRAYINTLEATVAELRKKIAVLGGTGVSVEENPSNELNDGQTLMQHGMFDAERLLQLEEKNQSLQDRLQTMLQHLASNEMRAITAEKALEEIGMKLHPGQEKPDGTDEENVAFIAEMLASYKEERSTLEIPLDDGREGADVTEPPAVQSKAVQQASDSHTQQQLRMHNELKQLNGMLAQKEQLRRRYLGQGDAESSVVTTPACNLHARLQEYEATIKSMEMEQHDTVKVGEKTLKLSEERRQKLRQLESELTVLRQERALLQNRLKQKEKDGQRVADLTAEIKAMKTARINLLKAMRTEHDKFRQWRQTQEKQICQLKAKDRKRQYEIQKMESMYSMQKQVMLRRMDVEKKALQRKMDETAAVNRRLKAALDRRQRTPNGPGADRSKLRGAEALRWIDQELELLHSAVDATESLKMMRQYRDDQADLLMQLKSKANEPLDAENDQELREAHSERIGYYEESRRVRNETIVDLEQKLQSVNIEEQLTTFSAALATLPEIREAVRRVLDVLVQKVAKLSELQCKEVAVPLPSIDEAHAKKRKTIDISSLSDAQYWELMQPDHGANLSRVERRKPKVSREHYLQELQEEYEEDAQQDLLETETEEDLVRDPTFRGTPMHKRRKMTSILPVPNPGPFQAHCSCTTNCSTKRCGCQKNGTSCSEACKCPEGCVNMNKTDKQENTPNPTDAAEETHLNKTYVTDELDILTYVKQNKKRKPLIDL